MSRVMKLWESDFALIHGTVIQENGLADRMRQRWKRQEIRGERTLKKKGGGYWMVDRSLPTSRSVWSSSETNCRLPTSHRLPSAASALAL